MMKQRLSRSTILMVNEILIINSNKKLVNRFNDEGRLFQGRILKENTFFLLKFLFRGFLLRIEEKL